MPQDLFTLNYLQKELNTTIVGAKIQKINVPDDYEVVFTIYNGKTLKLCLSARAKYARVSLLHEEKKNPIVAKNFCMLLRKYLLGAKIKGVEIAGNDRIIKLVLENENDLKEKTTHQLYVEIMNKYSNVFLVNNGVIMGALRQAPQNLDGKRITLTGAKYTLPEKQNKISPYNSEDLHAVYSKFNGGDLSNFITQNIDGFSPVTAREIEHLISLKGEFSIKTAVDVTLSFMNKNANPVIITSGNKSDYYAFDYTHINGERKYFSSILDAVSEWATIEELKLSFDVMKNALSSKINAYEKKQLKNLDGINEKITEASGAEKVKLYAELITANIYALKKGMTEARLVNYYSENGDSILIPLDKNLTPNENAQKYYKKYAKLKKTVNALAPRKDEILNELNYIESIKFEIDNASDVTTLEEISDEITLINLNGKETKTNKKTKREISKPREYIVEKFAVKVGKNNVQNDELTFSSNRYDLWLHTKNYHSSHVIIQTENKPVSDSVILTVAEICAYFSSGKQGEKIPVDYTYKKYVKKPPKAKPGSVIYTDFKTVYVTPNEHKELLKN